MQALELTDYQGKKVTGASLFEEDLAYTLEPVRVPDIMNPPRLRACVQLWLEVEAINYVSAHDNETPLGAPKMWLEELEI